MSAELIKRHVTQDGRTYAIVEVLKDGRRHRYHVTIKPVQDFNGRVTGVKYWVRPDTHYACEDDALVAAMADVEALVGE